MCRQRCGVSYYMCAPYIAGRRLTVRQSSKLSRRFDFYYAYRLHINVAISVHTTKGYQPSFDFRSSFFYMCLRLSEAQLLWAMYSTHGMRYFAKVSKCMVLVRTFITILSSIHGVNTPSRRSTMHRSHPRSNLCKCIRLVISR